MIRKPLKKYYEFLYKELPNIIKEKQPFSIKPLNRSDKFCEFQINSFLNNQNSNRNIYSIQELLNNLNVEQIKKLMKIENLELIGVDESKVEVPLEGSIFTYLKSTALRMFKDENGNKVELIGPVVQEIKLNYVYSEKQDKEIQFLEYLRNLFIVLLAIKNSLSHERHPLIFLHGPLVRAIGGFTDLFFEYEDLKEILSINLDEQEGVDISILDEINGKNYSKNYMLLKKKKYGVVIIYVNLRKLFFMKKKRNIGKKLERSKSMEL